MTSRERVLAAIAHKAPDQIPLDIGATPSSNISAIAYSNFVKFLGKGDLPVYIYDVVQQLAQPDQYIIDTFEVDILDIGRAFNDKPSDWYPIQMANGAKAFYPQWYKPVLQPDGSYVTFDDDGQRILSKMPVGATFFDQTYFPYADGYPDSYENLGAEMNRVMWSRHTCSPWDHSGEPDFYQQLRERTLHLHETTDKALMIGCGCNLFEWGTFLRRLDNFLVDLLADPYHVECLLDALVEKHLATLEKVCAAVGDIVDVVRFGDDLGMVNGAFMDAKTYRTLFKPRLKVMCDYVKSHSRMHTFLHSCGSISNLMPDIIDAGIEIFNPVQTNAYNMSPKFLKKEFGKACTFWGGGIENVGVLNSRSEYKIRKQVFEHLDIFSEGGGFIFATEHNILPDVPPENILAMLEALQEYNNWTL